MTMKSCCKIFSVLRALSREGSISYQTCWDMDQPQFRSLIRRIAPFTASYDKQGVLWNYSNPNLHVIRIVKRFHLQRLKVEQKGHPIS